MLRLSFEWRVAAGTEHGHRRLDGTFRVHHLERQNRIAFVLNLTARFEMTGTRTGWDDS